jgi:hypothetical protein
MFYLEKNTLDAEGIRLPQRWLHNLIDVITHGKYVDSHWYYHKWKDDPWRRLGKAHRIERHDDYLKIVEAFKENGIELKSDNAFVLLESLSRARNSPINSQNVDVDTELLIGLAHEAVDHVWSSLSREQKIEWAKAFKDVVLNPTRYFETGLLEPCDIELDEFKRLQKLIENKTIEVLI